MFKSAGDPDPVYATYQHHLPPDPNAALQWLRVRQPKKWGGQAEDKPGSITAEMVEKALARAREHRAANPMPSRQPLLEDVAPDPDLEPSPRP